MPAREPVSLGEYLRRLRVRAGFSQEELAERAGVTVDTISAVERGLRRRVYPQTARALADALGLSSDDRVTFAELAQGIPASAAHSPRRSAHAMGQPGSDLGVRRHHPSAAERRDTDAEERAASPPAHGRVTVFASQAPSVEGNLPAPLSNFVGRVQEQADLIALLSAHRLVTLVAIGGSGKTRLALEVARTVQGQYPDGVWWVDLAPHADATAVAGATAASLGLREHPGQTRVEAMTGALQARRLLLVLDNCEHVVEGCARLTEALLTACPHLTILATSREPLGLPGEQEFRLHPLPVPDEAESPGIDPSSLLRWDAVRLLIERVTARVPDFELGAENAPAVAEICRRLDGLPLALELAAARVPVMTVEELVRRLDDRFRVLGGGSRTALSRQQTLRAMMDWSHDLLSPAERVLFRRLSVFAGSFTLEAAEAVCAYSVELPATSESDQAMPSTPTPYLPLPSSEVLDLLTGLIARSLVDVTEQEPGGRFRMLETVRQYAADHLATAGERAATSRRHAAHMLEVAERVEPTLTGPRRSEGLAQLDAEHDNLRAALTWYASAHDHMGGLRLAGALLWYWYLRGYVGEGRDLAEAILAAARDARVTSMTSGIETVTLQTAWAKALHCAGVLAWVQGDWSSARERLEASRARWQHVGTPAGLGRAETYLGLVAWSCRDEDEARAHTAAAIQLLRDQDDRWGLAFALNAGGLAAQIVADHERARLLYEESASIFRSLDDPWGLSLPLIRLGWTTSLQGDFAGARAALETSLALRRMTRDPFAVAMALGALGELERHDGNSERAATLHAERLTLFCRIGDSIDAAYAAHDLARVLLDRQDGDRARALFMESLTVASAKSIAPLAIACLGGLATAAEAAGQVARAAHLFGAADAALDRLGDHIAVTDEFDWDGVTALVRGAAGTHAATAAWNAGRAAPLELAIALALG